MRAGVTRASRTCAVTRWPWARPRRGGHLSDC